MLRLKKITRRYDQNISTVTFNCQLSTVKNCQLPTKSCHCWYFLAGYLELSVEIILMTCFLLWMAAPRKRRIHSISRRRSPKRELLRRTCQQRREQKGMMLMTELSGTICSPAGNLPTGTAWVLLLWPWLFFENRATAGWNQRWQMRLQIKKSFGFFKIPGKGASMSNWTRTSTTSRRQDICRMISRARSQVLIQKRQTVHLQVHQNPVTTSFTLTVTLKRASLLQSQGENEETISQTGDLSQGCG